MSQKELPQIFKGRLKERSQLIEFVRNNNNGYFCLLGHPGIGKSALVAQFVKDLHLDQELNNVQIIEYWIRRGTAQAQGEYFMNDFIQRTDNLFPQAKEIKAQGKTILDLKQQLFSKWRLWGEKNRDKKLLILIDGLDEGAENNLVSYLPREIFENILIVYSSRTGGHQSIEELWPSLPIENLAKIELTGLLEKDIRDLMCEVAQKYKLKCESNWIEVVVNASKGNPLYLKLLCDSIEKGTIKINESNVLPNELNDYYKTIFQRYAAIYNGEDLLKSICSLAAAKDFLTINHLGFINKLNPETLQSVGNIIKEICYERTLADGVIGYQLFHESFREYLVKEEALKVAEANNEIIIFCSSWRGLAGKWEQLYALEHYTRHLNESKKKEHQIELMDLFQDKEYTSAQKKVLRHFDATKMLYQCSLEKSIEMQNYHLQLEASLHLVDLKNEEASDAPQVLALVENNEIELALKRIESFADVDKEGVKRKFKFYMLCLMELTLLDSKDKPFRKDAIEKLLNHLDEQLPADTSFLNWDDFFPGNLVFKMAGEWAALGLDYMIVYKRASREHYLEENYLEREAPFSDIQFEVLKRISRDSFVISQLVKQQKIQEVIEYVLSQDNDFTFNQQRELADISCELAKQGKLEAAFECAAEIRDEQQKSFALEAISTELAENGKIEKALECAAGINDERNKSSALKSISIELAKKGRFDDAIEHTRDISNDFIKSSALAEISTEIAKKGKIKEARECVTRISEEVEKSLALMSISSELAKKGKMEEAESLLQEALNCISEMIKKENTKQSQEENEMEESSWDEFESFEDDDEFENYGEDREGRIAFLKDEIFGDDYDENQIPFRISDTLHSLYTEMVIQGKFLEAKKFILGFGNVMDKINSFLHLSTQLVIMNQIEEVNELILMLYDFLSNDEKHWAKKISTLALIEQDRMEEAKFEMEATINLTISDERGNDCTWWCFEEFLPALENNGKLVIAADWVNSLYADWVKDKFFSEISLKLAQQGQINESLRTAIKISNNGDKVNTLASISSELYMQGQPLEAESVMQKAYKLTLDLHDDDWRKGKAIKSLSAELFYQGKWLNSNALLLDSITSVWIIPDEKYKSGTLKDISGELAKQGKFEEAFECVRGISDEYCKDIALETISIELAKHGMIQKAIECALGIGVYKKREALGVIFIELVKLVMIDEVLECAQDIGNESDKNSVLEVICKELLYLTKFNEAIICVKSMTNELDKCEALTKISAELAKQGISIRIDEEQLNLFESVQYKTIDSLSVLNEALECTLHITNERQKCRALMLVSAELEAQGQKVQVVPVLLEALSNSRKSGNDYWGILRLKDISNALFKQGEIEEATLVLNEAYTHAISHDDTSYKYKLLLSISSELETQGQIKKAKSVMREVVSVVRATIEEEEKSFELGEILPNLIRHAMVKDAFSCAYSLDYFKSNAIQAIYRELVIQGRLEEALTFSQGLSDDTEKSSALESIAIELAEQSRFDDALVCAHDISNEYEKDNALKSITIELAKQSRFDDALVCAHDISSKNFKDDAQCSIVMNLAKNGKFEKAFGCAQGISVHSHKSRALHHIVLELIKQRNFAFAERVGFEISNLSHRHKIWQEITDILLKEMDWQQSLLAIDQFKQEEARVVSFKAFVRGVDILKVDTLFMQECLRFLVYDSESIEVLLTKHAVRSLFLTDISLEQINRFKKTLNIQWAEDVLNIAS